MSARKLLYTALACLLCLLASCGEARDPGAVEWGFMQSAFEAGSFDQVIDRLDRMEGVPGWSERAAGWRVVLLGGMTHAYLELNEACEAGVAESNGRPDRNLQRALEQYRKDARRYSIELYEAVQAFDKLTGDSEAVSLDFDLPDGDASPSAVIARISSGMMPSEQGLKGSEQYTIRRGVLLQATRAVGAGDKVDTAKKMFEFSPVSTPKAVYLLGVGRTIHEAAALYGVKRLRDHKMQELFLGLAEKCVRPSLESKNLGLQSEAEEILRAIEQSRSKMEDRDAADE